MTKIVLIVALILNLITFLLYGIDKLKAKKHRWRISEALLLGVAAIGGSLGATFGMWIFRHKTKHWKFRIGIPLFLIVHIAVIVLLFHAGILP